MAAEAVIRFAAILAAAMTIAAAPVLAQTNDPRLPKTKIDCLNRANAAGADCAKDGSGETPAKGPVATGAVVLPQLIIDLFPNPVAGGE